MTVKRFFIYLGCAFLLGFALMFCYHLINKPKPELVIENPVNEKLKFQFDSLITESKIKDLKVEALIEQVKEITTLYDSLIAKNHVSGKEKKDKKNNGNHNSLVNWNDSMLRANKLNR